MKRVLVLGSSGMLGHVALLRLQELGYDVFGVSSSRIFGKKSAQVDVFFRESFNSFLDNNSFDVIVNCIALLVSQSESQKDRAVYLNSYIPHFLEHKYINTRTRIFQVSTDGIFLGKKPPYSESSPHEPEHFYGKTKYLGEISNDKDLTVRSAFWGSDLNEKSTSLFNWILHQNDTVNGFTNHFFNGVSSIEFANFLDIAIRNEVAGIFHLTAKCPISKYDFICLTKKVFSLTNDIVPVENQSVDRTLVNNRTDVDYSEKDYCEMLTDCLLWIREHSVLYTHYNNVT